MALELSTFRDTCQDLPGNVRITFGPRETTLNVDEIYINSEFFKCILGVDLSDGANQNTPIEIDDETISTLFE